MMALLGILIANFAANSPFKKATKVRIFGILTVIH